MLQIKMWSWNIKRPKGKTAEEIQNEINQFLKENNCLEDSFEIFELTHGFMFAKILYKTRRLSKSKKKTKR